MSARRLRVGVIGTGLMGRLHAQNLAYRIREAELVAVADIAGKAAEDCASLSGAEAAYQDYGELLSHDDIDAVAICTPPDTHAEIISAAAAAGKHVFCEKPLAVEVDAAREALANAQRAGVKVQVGFNRRFDDRFRRAHYAIGEGTVGDIYTVHVISRDPVRTPGEIPKFEPDMFLDTTIHDLDMLRFVTGREVLNVHAAGHPSPDESRSPQTAVTLLALEGGAFVTIDNSWFSLTYDQRLEVFGSKGVVTVENQTESGASAERDRDTSQPFFVRRYFDSYLEEMAAFVECIARDEPPQVTGEDGLAALLLALAARLSWREGRPVALVEVG